MNIEEQQARFNELWNKVADDTATVAERREMLEMQVEYWTKRELEKQDDKPIYRAV